VITAEYEELRPREVGLDHHRRSTNRSSSPFLGLQASNIGTKLEGGVRRQVTLTTSEEKIPEVLKALEKEEEAPFVFNTHSSGRSMTVGCLRIAARKRMSVEEQEEDAVKYCNTTDADCDCCCDAASYSSSSNSSYCNCIAWRQLLQTPATATIHLPFPVSRLPLWSTLRSTSARSSDTKLSQDSNIFTPIVSNHMLFWWSFQMPPIRRFQWLGG